MYYPGLGSGSDVVWILSGDGGGVWVDDDDAVFVGVFHARLARHEWHDTRRHLLWALTLDHSFPYHSSVNKQTVFLKLDRTIKRFYQFLCSWHAICSSQRPYRLFVWNLAINLCDWWTPLITRSTLSFRNPNPIPIHNNITHNALPRVAQLQSADLSCANR